MVSPSSIVALVINSPKTKGPYRRQSLIQFSQVERLPKASRKYAAETLLGAEIHSILYENVLFSTIYTRAQEPCLTKIPPAQHMIYT